ncbi:hypothetical protein GW17_00061619 [Ensete ventricosum]|nr:hypothetical protein GW17_00061619 [Ensete ventricosum]
MPHLCLHSVGSMSDDDLGCVSVLCPASTEKTVNLHPGQNESVNGSTNIHNSISPCGVVDLGLGERRREKADYSNSYSFIEGLKSNKARRYELSDIAGHIVEFRQFFKHGNPEQRKELAIKLVGNVMPLSLQMYGCRVIQKVSSSG